ncbi:hypothetical protein CC80DRAFT_4233 [Byssothecium circinans]|uniref:DNA (cytosine-5-)-methyltransferase n=1 Tax=Byssothecium circinans TaxID=147558 RepID=A0A6A5UHE0_9PLEO|nr:hypothetical protein CC80DRAFT_4233 [Byssothecium circinans]
MNPEWQPITNRSKSPKVVIPTAEAARKLYNVSTALADYARSQDKSWNHGLEVTTEKRAIALLRDEWNSKPRDSLDYDGYQTNKELMIADLHDFEIYTSPHQKRAHELSSLEFLDVQGRELWFDGVLSIGSVIRYVQGVPIKFYSVEGYGVDNDPASAIYIQSHEASQDRNDIWYRLQVPSVRYQAFHKVFHWVAGLGKHVIDYLEQAEGTTQVGLNAFRQDFYCWLLERFPNSATFTDWFRAYGSTDFRKAINAHIDYLVQEAYNLSNRQSLLRHQLWADCMREDHPKIKPQPRLCDKTIATPHVYNCFKNRYFAHRLLECKPSESVQDAAERRKRRMGFLPGFPEASRRFPQIRKLQNPSFKASFKVKVGDVVGILPDDEELRIWRKSTKDLDASEEKSFDVHNHLWYAYVHRVEPAREGLQRLFVIWMYLPENTTISTTDYPVKNEIFLSDHCNCQEGVLLSSDVALRATIEWFSTDYSTPKDFIVRQKFITEDSSFVSLNKTDFTCDCQKPKPCFLSTCQPGDTVYITTKRRGTASLDPVVIHNINHGESKLTVRRLLRLKDYAPHPRSIPDNELIWTTKFFEVSFKRVQRRCHVRYFGKDSLSGIPYPYNRGGASDFWILSSQITSDDRQQYQHLTEPPSQLNQGPDLKASSFNKLPGLSLFSGAGNLDKGLEEAGAVEFNGSVDMSPEAIQTLYANAERPDQLKLWLGSVDDNLKALLHAKDMHLVAQIGEVAVISAGSPCPGFSSLQSNWLSEQSCRNASHVTTFCSYVDIYRPKWAFLENVVTMASKRTGYEKELVLSQLIACLVSMGYQVQQFIMSSWNYGSAQQRSRLMLSIAAPGLTPITPPVHTHGNPDKLKFKSIGELMTGQKFGLQLVNPTPFPHVTASQLLNHLPNIENGLVQGCIRSPDHRVSAYMNGPTRRILELVPVHPPGQGLQQAIDQGLVPQRLYENRREIGSSYQRIKGNGLIPTIVTAICPHDARNSACVHWEQHRPLTIEEARLAQGIPSDVVIIGSLREQFRMVGNAVDRHVSEPLGLALRRALESDLGIIDHRPVPISRGSSSDSMLSVIHVGRPRRQTVEHEGESSAEDSDGNIVWDAPQEEQCFAVAPNSMLHPSSQAISRGVSRLPSFSATSSLAGQPTFQTKRQRGQKENHLQDRLSPNKRSRRNAPSPESEERIDSASTSEPFARSSKYRPIKSIETVPFPYVKIPATSTRPPRPEDTMATTQSSTVKRAKCGPGRKPQILPDDSAMDNMGSIALQATIGRQKAIVQPLVFPRRAPNPAPEPATGSQEPTYRQLVFPRSPSPFTSESADELAPERATKTQEPAYRKLVLPRSPSPFILDPAEEEREADVEPLVFPKKVSALKRASCAKKVSSLDIATERSSARKTRHSGLEVEFKPRAWSKKPEAEVGRFL